MTRALESRARPAPLALELLPGRRAVCRLGAGEAVPEWAWRSPWLALTRTPEELSLVCDEELVPAEVRAVGGWRCLRVSGTLDFAEIGVLASLSGCLTQAAVSLFAVSTYDTDYLLVQQRDLERALAALVGAGHSIEESDG